MRKVLFALCSICILLNACTREDPGTQGAGLLEKVVIRNSDDVSYTSAYSYDRQNRLTHIRVGSSFYSWKAVTEIQYDLQGRLHKAIFYHVNDSNVITKLNHSYSYVYDNNNRIIRKIYTPLSPTTAGGKDHRFEYDAQGRLIADYTLADQSGVVERYTVFVYDSNNNVVEIKEHSGSATVPSYTYYLTYDNKQNPYTNFTGLNTRSYFVSSHVHDLGVSNVLRRFLPGDDPEIYKHEYSPSGRLARSTTFPESHPQFSSTMEYFFND